VFVAASYNVLATAYIQPDRYRRTPAGILDPAWRVPALVRHIAALNADLLCLQEVEPAVFDALGTSLGQQGYAGEYARKRAGRPEGVATFFRRTRFTLTDSRVLAGDDTDRTGHVTQFVVLAHEGRTLGAINTHLTWDAPGTPAADRRGLRQAQRIVDEQRRRAGEADAWMIMGDFNVTADHDIVALVRDAGFRFAHEGLDGVFTCNANGAARLVDYVFCANRLTADAVAPKPIGGGTILPGEEDPSDHLPLLARIDWRDR
jgi:mRNA deadenylase 3'-5' endonuclease subunit Ccr4